MERLFLSGEMEGFPVRTDNRHVHHESMKGDVEETGLLGRDENDSSQVLPTNEEVIGPFTCSPRSHEAESDLSTTRTATPWSPLIVESTLPPTSVSTASVESSFRSDFKSHVGLNADDGSDAGVAKVAGKDTGVTTQVPMTLPILSAESIESDGLSYKAEDEDGLAAEDWLHVAEALDAVT